MGAVIPRRNRTLALALVALTLSVLIVASAIWSETDRRIRGAADQQRETAQLLARLVDVRCRTSAALLQLEAGRSDLSGSLEAGSANEARALLRELAPSAPSAVGLSLHRSDGHAVAAYPAGSAGPAGWLVDRSTSRGSVAAAIVRRPTAPDRVCLAVAAPIRRASGSAGYLVAYYDIDPDRIASVSKRDGSHARILVADTRGTILAETGPAGVLRGSQTRRALPTRLLQAQNGTAILPADNKADEAVAGIARAQIPGWAVLVTRPVGSVRASALAAYAPMIGMFTVTFSALLLAAWHFPRLYQRHEAMRAQLIEQNKRLKELDVAKSEFLANVSHDLWTPLASLELSLSGLLDPTIQWRPEQARQSLQLANHELTQLISRVRNLLEMARLDANADMGQKEPCDLSDIVGSALERMAPLLKDREVRADFPAYPLMLNCRHAQLEIVIMNLIDNALKYSPPGSPLYLKGERRGRDVYVSLRDFGPGVAPGDNEAIFQQFYRAEQSKTKTGSGLGLAICKAVVESHGGVVGVFNAPGGGAEFWISVPGLPKDKLD